VPGADGAAMWTGLDAETVLDGRQTVEQRVTVADAMGTGGATGLTQDSTTSFPASVAASAVGAAGP